MGSSRLDPVTVVPGLHSSYDSVLDAAAVAGVAATPRSRPATASMWITLATERSSRGFLFLDLVAGIMVRCKVWTMT